MSRGSPTPDPPHSHNELQELLESWTIHLRGERKSKETVKLYRAGVRAFLRWCAATDCPPSLDKTTVSAFVADILETGREAATARTRAQAMRRFSAWLAAEGEIEEDRLASLRAPKVDSKVAPVLSDDQLRAMIQACAGTAFRERRDEAILRLMTETGARAGEVVKLRVPDIDLKAGMATIRGKGGKGRRIPIGPQTLRSLDRYLRARRRHRLAHTDALWLGDRGKAFDSYGGLYAALNHRAELAGIADFHPHMMRHTAASRWLEKGGSEDGLMTVAGWSHSDMLRRYTRARAEERAAQEAQRLNLGDL